MRFKSFCLAAVIVSVFNFTLPVLADAYQGGGFTVTIDGTSYQGCSSHNDCIYIPYYSYRERGAYIWDNNGYSYDMTPIRDNTGRYYLKVYAPNGSLLLKQIMIPIFNEDIREAE